MVKGKEKITIGVVGTGERGTRLLRSFSVLEDCAVSWVCDPGKSIDQLQPLMDSFPAARLTTEFEDMLGDRGLDVVVVATQLSQHYHQAHKALLAGKDVFLDRPMSTTTSQCSNLIRLAWEHGKVLMVDQAPLYHAAIQGIKETIDAGHIGQLLHVSAEHLNLGPFSDKINAAWDLAPYDLTTILHVLEDMPLTLNCQGSARFNPGIEDVTHISLEFEGSRCANIRSCWLYPRKVNQMKFVGSRKMILYDHHQKEATVRIYDKRVEAESMAGVYGGLNYTYHHGDVRTLTYPNDDLLTTACDDFVQRVRTRRFSMPNLKLGMKVVQILEKADESLRLKGAHVQLSQSRQADRPWISEHKQPYAGARELHM